MTALSHATAAAPAMADLIRSDVAAALPADGVASPARIRSVVAAALRTRGVSRPRDVFAVLVRDVSDHLAGLGPLEGLLRTPGVTDVMVNGPDEVWIERDGVLQRTDVTFASADAVMAAVRRVVTPVGGRIDRARPFVDARLADGSRLHAVAAPICSRGPLVTLRRFDAASLTWETLMAAGSVPPQAARLLRQAIVDRRCVVLCGRTGTGKTTLLQRLVDDVGADERVVLIEDSPELQPQAPHVVRLGVRPPSAEGVVEIDIADLVRQSLRMRPDRIIVGEVRGVEVAAVLQALITGHEGCMTTVHARSGVQALLRLEGMALQAGLPLAAAQAQLGSALEVLVSLGRGPAGQRGVTEIAEVTGRQGRPEVSILWRRSNWSVGPAVGSDARQLSFWAAA